ncbi:MAG: hypothetical protein WC286_05005, partial [Bacilli bacterium]
MKINLPPDSLPKLKKLISVKDENILVSELLLRYLLNSEKYPLKVEFKRRSANASTKEQLYAAMLAVKISPKHRG